MNRTNRLLPACLVLGLMSCTDRTEPAPHPSDAGMITAVTPGPVPAGPPAVELASAELPLTGYFATDDEHAFVDRAYVQLANRCMARFGFPPRLVAPGADGSKTTAPVTWRYGTSDPAIARQYGYHAPPQLGLPTSQEVTAAQQREAANPMNAEEELVYTGSDPAKRTYRDLPIPDGGCMGEAKQHLGSTPEGHHMDDMVARSLSAAGLEQSRKDSRVTAVLRDWSSCMRESGHNEADPLDATKKFDLFSPVPSSAEIATATADAECKKRTNLVATWYTIEVAYHKALVQANITRLEATRHSIDAALTAAAAILNEPIPY